MAVNTNIDPEDAAAEQQAAQAREEGTAVIREHLQSHMRSNPTSSYVVSWAVSLARLTSIQAI